MLRWPLPLIPSILDSIIRLSRILFPTMIMKSTSTQQIFPLLLSYGPYIVSEKWTDERCEDAVSNRLKGNDTDEAANETRQSTSPSEPNHTGSN